jgi:hypothetical protein
MSLAQKLGSDEAQRAWRLACANWALVAVMGLGLGLTLFGFTLDLPDFGIVLGIAAIYGVMGFFHLWRKQVPDPKVALILTAIGQLIFIVAFMGPLTYVAGAFNFPLRDDLYLAADRVLGLDPRLLLAFVNDRPELAMWFETAYGMIRWPLIGIPVILAMAMRYERLQLFVMAFGIALIATLAVSALLPAVGTYYGLGIGPETITPNLNAMIYGKQAQDIPAIRDGSLRDLEVFKLAGIVAFPSFHAASAILYAWALWPVRGFGIAAAIVNAAMLAATPVIGAHYVVDVIGGVGVAMLSFAAARRFASREDYAVTASDASLPATTSS